MILADTNFLLISVIIPQKILKMYLLIMNKFVMLTVDRWQTTLKLEILTSV